ncbi:MAG TPA: hypothetical protein VHZ03_46590 [Trebonia sp.]|nr:hypothetical protein [Trebonia sp.]
MFLLSVATVGTGRPVVLADREIEAKTNEIPELGPLLLELSERFPLAGHVISADALHAQRALATLITEKLQARYLFTVKRNQPGLHDALAALCWAGARRCVTSGEGRGRLERRSHLIMAPPRKSGNCSPTSGRSPRSPAPAPSPPEKQRQETDPRHQDRHRDRLPDHQPVRPRGRPRAHRRLRPQTLEHRNQVHLVRDVTLREDTSKVHAGNRARNLATLRNAEMGLIRQHGRTGIAATIRDAEYDKHLIHALLRLEPAL